MVDEPTFVPVRHRALRALKAPARVLQRACACVAWPAAAQRPQSLDNHLSSPPVLLSLSSALSVTFDYCCDDKNVSHRNVCHECSSNWNSPGLLG